jgi:rare lipoprotein A
MPGRERGCAVRGGAVREAARAPLAALVAALLGAVLAAGCRESPAPPDAAPAPPPADAAPPPPAPPPERAVRVLRGIAIWYGARWHGKKTASGERFDRHGLTAAHRTLPLGTRVRVTSLDSGRQVIVRINDRGPYGRDRRRVIDLSEEAARRLGFLDRGSARVVIEVLAPRESDDRGEEAPGGPR